MARAGVGDDRLNLLIVGAGRVGATTAYAALLSGIADEITLVDQDPARAEGEAMDLMHGLPFVPPAELRAAGWEACREADVIVLTAGAARKPGDTRVDLARRNLELMADIIPRIAAETRNALLLVVSNPVDLITRAARELGDFPPRHVIGSGTVLDTARLRSLLARHFAVDARSINAFVVGEHGDSQFPAWSLARIGGATLGDLAKATGREWNADVRRRIADEVRKAGAEVIRRKGATHFAIGLATAWLARALLRDERSVHTVSTECDGRDGPKDVALSLPCVLGREGRIATVPIKLDEAERESLEASADFLRKTWTECSPS